MATAVRIDLNTRFIKGDERVFIARPGEDFRFYNDFNRNGRIFLDVPGLNLNGFNGPPAAAELAPLLGMSERVRSWHRKRRPPEAAPSRNPDDYQNFGVTQRRAVIAGAIREMYFGARKGELVIVPGPGYWSDVLIGEFADDPGIFASVDVDAIYPGERIPGRRVRWLTRVTKGSLDPELIRRLQTPHPFTLVGKSMRDELYRLAYPNFSFDDTYTAKIFTREPEFTTVDDLTIQLFVNQVVALWAGKELDEEPASVEKALAFLNAHPEVVPDLAININSPGNLTIYSQRLVPLVIAALLALALSGAAPLNPADIEVVNSAAGATAECTAAVDESVKDILRIMGYDRWKETCDQLQATAARTGLAPQVPVTR
ncbi:hypothetical protein [Brevundimonas sp. FT23028]|uniref:hypothetical protein n=1 Tax=Brevundimonas sp. FT23028 TaxID=3393748 RepID=UPI003B58A875